MQLGAPGVSPALINSWYRTLKAYCTNIEFDWSDRKPVFLEDPPRIEYRGKVKINYPHLNEAECRDIASYFKFVGEYGDRMRDYGSL